MHITAPATHCAYTACTPCQVRNSWTPEWGQEGYIKVLRSNHAVVDCGVDLSPLDGDGCATGPNKSPPQIKVCGVSGILYDGAYPVL